MINASGASVAPSCVAIASFFLVMGPVCSALSVKVNRVVCTTQMSWRLLLWILGARACFCVSRTLDGVVSDACNSGFPVHLTESIAANAVTIFACRTMVSRFDITCDQGVEIDLIDSQIVFSSLFANISSCSFSFSGNSSITFPTMAAHLESLRVTTGVQAIGPIFRLVGAFLTVRDTRVHGSVYVAAGDPFQTLFGAIFAAHRSELNVTDSSFSNNVAPFVTCVNLMSSIARFSNVEFHNNSAATEVAVLRAQQSNVTFMNCSFRQNSAQQGSVFTNVNSRINIVNSTFDSNEATLVGAVAFIVSGDIFISRSLLRSSLCNQGAAIFAIGGNLTISDSALSGNYARFRGGAFFASGGAARFIRCNFTDNVATFAGGAAVLSGGTAVFVNCLFSNNSAARGAALAVTGGSVTTNSTLFIRNSASDTAAVALVANGPRICAKSHTAGKLEIFDSVMVQNVGAGGAGALGVLSGSVLLCFLSSN